ncbi:MAG: HAD-IIB family hydrolase [Acidobacteriota bacterium]
MSFIVITDLDGTLLDHLTYDYAPALPALHELKRQGVPVVFCSSKTAAEIIPLRREMEIGDPFIVENGGGAYIPEGYFPPRKHPNSGYRKDGFQVMPLGRPYAELLATLNEIGEELDFEFQHFKEFSPEEISARMGLSVQEARRAQVRDFDLPFTIEGTATDLKALEEAVRQRGLRLFRGGRFFHLTGDHDKGTAARLLVDLLSAQEIEPGQSIGLGDSQNDLSLLRVVDLPIRIPNPHSAAALSSEIPRLRTAPAPGPAGWNAAVLAIIGVQ